MDLLETVVHKQTSDVTRFQSLIAGDFSLIRFTLLPYMNEFKNDPRWMAKAVGVSVDQSLGYIDLLFDQGIWSHSSNGKIEVTDSFIQYAQSIPDFLTASASLHAKLALGGRSWFKFENWATSEQAVSNLVKKVNKALVEFREESREADGETMVSFSFSIGEVINQASKTEGN